MLFNCFYESDACNLIGVRIKGTNTIKRHMKRGWGFFSNTFEFIDHYTLNNEHSWEVLRN